MHPVFFIENIQNVPICIPIKYTKYQIKEIQPNIYVLDAESNIQVFLDDYCTWIVYDDGFKFMRYDSVKKHYVIDDNHVKTYPKVLQKESKIVLKKKTTRASNPQISQVNVAQTWKEAIKDIFLKSNVDRCISCKQIMIDIDDAVISKTKYTKPKSMTGVMPKWYSTILSNLENERCIIFSRKTNKKGDILWTSDVTFSNIVT